MGLCPLCFFLVLLTSISHDGHRALGNKVFRVEQNVGTVLFERSDCGKHCWTSEEFTILNSRRMFQDILPKVKVINCQNDQYIALLMDYFHICLECVRKLSIGKTKHLILKALADTMGGYLQVYILPLTKHSYYAGNIKYRNAKRLFELFDELKNFLHTNGIGWMKPSLDTKHVKTPPIVIVPPKSSMACNGLVTYPAPLIEADIQEFHPSILKRKRYAPKRRSSRNSPMGSHDYARMDSGPVIVPLPFLDDELQPNSIALPFKTDNLMSLYCEKSAFALVKYYVASVKCIVSRSKTKVELARFNKDLFEWLKLSAFSHLDDEKWYPAFGGILRVMASLKETGLGSTGTKEKQGGDYQMMPKVMGTTKRSEVEAISPLYKGKDENEEESSISFGTTELVVIALAGALLVWLLVGLTLVCYRFLTRHPEECSPCESPTNTPVAVLYENTEYCQPDVCASKTSRKSASEKLKNWLKNKVGSCPGGCNDYEEEERCLAEINYSSKDSVNVTDSTKSYRKKRYSKSISASQSVSPRDCPSSRKDCYSSDDTSSNSERRAKSR